MTKQIEQAITQHVARITNHTVDMIQFSNDEEFEKATIKRNLIKELNLIFAIYMAALGGDSCNQDFSQLANDIATQVHLEVTSQIEAQ